MSKQMLRTFWILALFAGGAIAGCSGQTSLPPNPVVVAITPANHVGNVLLAQVVSVTFNKAMNRATITSTTFTLTSPGGIGVPGTVASAGTTSSFTPTLPLALGTVYTVTVTTGVQDTLGNAGLLGDGPARQRARPSPEHDPLGRVEQLVTRITQGHAGWQDGTSFRPASGPVRCRVGGRPL